MEIKNLPNTFAFVYRVQTNMKDMGKYVGKIPMELVEKAATAGFKITGPQFWNYMGMDGDPGSDFQLEICLPVENSSSLQSEETEHIDGFRCATATVKGEWSKLKEGYEALLAKMASQNLQPGMRCREVYHQVDFEDPENCITEIQMSIN